MKNVKTTFNSIVSNNIGPPLTVWGKKKLILCFMLEKFQQVWNDM